MNKTLSRILVFLIHAALFSGCISSKAPENIPSPETRTEFQTPDPEEFIHDYFRAAVNERNYEYLWTLSTENFNEANYGNEYQIFVEYWNSVETLQIETVSVTDRTDSSAFCAVRMALRIAGNDISAETTYHLIFDPEKDSWVFESP